MKRALLDLLHDTAAFAAMTVFVVGCITLADRVAACAEHANACELSEIAPTDANLEACYGEPIDLPPSAEDDGDA